LLDTYYRLFWHVFWANFYSIIKFLLFFWLSKTFLNQLKITGSSLRSLSNILNCDSIEFSYCFRTNRTNYSWKFVNGLRQMKFKLHFLSDHTETYFVSPKELLRPFFIPIVGNNGIEVTFSALLRFRYAPFPHSDVIRRSNQTHA